MEEIKKEEQLEETKSEEDAKQTTEIEGEQATPESQEVDFEALYNDEKEARERAEHKIVKLRAKKLEEDETEETEEKPAEDIKSYVDRQLSEIQFKVQEDKFEAEIAKVSSNESEKKLIRFHLQNNKFAGDLETQVQKAKALANYKKLTKANEELALARSTKAGGEESSSYRPAQKKEATGLSERDIAHLKSRGLYEKYVEKYGV